MHKHFIRLIEKNSSGFRILLADPTGLNEWLPLTPPTDFTSLVEFTQLNLYWILQGQGSVLFIYNKNICNIILPLQNREHYKIHTAISMYLPRDMSSWKGGWDWEKSQELIPLKKPTHNNNKNNQETALKNSIFYLSVVTLSLLCTVCTKM